MRKIIIFSFIIVLMASACATTAPTSIPEKYNLDNQLERVSKFWNKRGGGCYWGGGGYVKSVDNQSFIFENSLGSYYLFVLDEPCDGLVSSEFACIRISGRLVRPGYSSVAVNYPGRGVGIPPYDINKIYKLKDREQVKAIRAQFSEGLD